MPTMMSTIGEATGLKPDDAVIGLGALGGAQVKAVAYLNAILMTTSPELRHLLTNHLNQVLAEHEKLGALALKKGWDITADSPEQYVQKAVEFAKPVVQQ